MAKKHANPTSLQNGRQKSGGRAAGRPNNSAKILKEALLIATEAAGNKKGRDGVVSYLTWVAINQPASLLPLPDRLIKSRRRKLFTQRNSQN